MIQRWNQIVRHLVQESVQQSQSQRTITSTPSGQRRFVRHWMTGLLLETVNLAILRTDDIRKCADRIASHDFHKRELYARREFSAFHRQNKLAARGLLRI